MRALLLLSLLLVLPAAAQTRGACAAGTATGVLDVGDVRARVFINGNLFFGASQEAEYVVPAATGIAAIYAANLWVGGTVGGELRTAGATYQSFAFRPGPLNADGSVPNPGDCSAHDRIYNVSIANIAAYAASGTATSDLRDWPVQWGAESYIDANSNHRRDLNEPLLVRAPGDAGYGACGSPINLAAGERPHLIGDQAAFWIMNDAAGPAGAVSTSAPIGLEVHVTAFAYGGSSAIGQATLYRFRLIKRSPGTFENARGGFWADTDLGDPSDDYVGVDSARNLAIVYNADNTDVPGYGVNPPAIGYVWVTGAGGHMHLSSSGALQRDPSTPQEMHHRLFSRWNDGQPLTEGGTGINPSGTVTPWAYSGDPVTGAYWSERNTDGNGTQSIPHDRRHLLSTATFTLTPNVPHDLMLAIPFGQGANHLASVTALRAASDAITGYTVDAEAGAPSPVGALALSVPRPNPTTGAAEVTLALAEASAVRVTVVDPLGRVVAVAHDGALVAGAQRIALPSGLPAGVYAVVAEANGQRATTRLSVVR